METQEVSRSDRGQKYLLVQLGMLRPTSERFHSLPFSRDVRCPAPASGRGFLFISTAIEMGRYLWPLGGNQYLRRLVRTQYLRRLGYNALSSLIIL